MFKPTKYLKNMLAFLLVFAACTYSTEKNSESDVFIVQYQTRDSSRAIVVNEKVIVPENVGIVIIDMWNYHWCKTSAARVSAMVPRMNRSLEQARNLGMQVFFCPTDVTNNYVGYPQREKAIAAKYSPFPASLNIECPHPGSGGCMCGEDECISNGGWTGMASDLVIEDADLLVSGTQELYNLCMEKGITELWYMGVHTNNCVLGKPEGMRNMMNYGFDCVLVRDLQDPETFYNPATGETPDSNNAKVVAHFEQYLAPSINIVETLSRNNLWNNDWIVDPVRITPWGTTERPHQFKDSVVITLSAPLNEGVEIRYTVDGTVPDAGAILYDGTFSVSTTTKLRAAAFKNGRAVTIESAAYFALLPPVPPVPDVLLTDLELEPMNRNTRKPVFNKSFQGQPLRIHQQVFENGVATIAPSFLTYRIKPEYKRFTAQCGIDDYIGTHNWGKEVAQFPAVIFKVFIDGKLVDESPVMRFGHWAWSFDISIPEGSEVINLVAVDAGGGNVFDYANWVNAGFVLSKD